MKPSIEFIETGTFTKTVFSNLSEEDSNELRTKILSEMEERTDVPWIGELTSDGKNHFCVAGLCAEVIRNNSPDDWLWDGDFFYHATAYDADSSASCIDVTGSLSNLLFPSLPKEEGDYLVGKLVDFNDDRYDEEAEELTWVDIASYFRNIIFGSTRA